MTDKKITLTRDGDERLEITQEITQYLKLYGYFEKVGSDVAAAIAAFQRFHRLPVTGELTKATFARIKTARCGCVDVLPLLPNSDFAEATAISGVATSHLGLAIARKYRIAEFTSHLAIDVQRNLIARAFKTWSNVVSVDFIEETEPVENISLNIIFSNHEGLISDRIVNYNNLGRTLSFADHVAWSDGRVANKFDLLSAAIHGIGHFLGLVHSQFPGQVMFPEFETETEKRFLRHEDLSQVRRLWAARVTSHAAKNLLVSGKANLQGQDHFLVGLCRGNDGNVFTFENVEVDRPPPPPLDALFPGAQAFCAANPTDSVCEQLFDRLEMIAGPPEFVSIRELSSNIDAPTTARWVAACVAKLMFGTKIVALQDSDDAFHSFGVLVGTPPYTARLIEASVVGGFETDSGWFSIAAGDIDGDGVDEIAALRSMAPNIVILKDDQHNGLTKVPLSIPNTSSLEWKDIVIGNLAENAQGRIVILSETERGVRVGQFSGTSIDWSPTTRIQFRESDWVALAAGDLDGDGFDEIVAANNSAGAIYVLKQKPSGALEVIGSNRLLGPNARITDVAIADLDHDGRAEIIVADRTAISIFKLFAPSVGLVAQYRSTASGTSWQAVTATPIVDASRPRVVAVGNHDGLLHYFEYNTWAGSLTESPVDIRE